MKNCTTSFIHEHFGGKPLISGILIFIMVLFGSIASMSAQEPTDSLMKLFKSKDLSENEKALICAKLGEQYLTYNVDSALHFAWNSFSFFEGINIFLLTHFQCCFYKFTH